MNPLDLYTLDQKSWAFFNLIGQTSKDFITTNLGVGMTPATVDVDIEKSNPGGEVALYLFNLSNTATSDAVQWIRIQGATARYAYTRYSVNGIQDWSIGTLGADQSFRISRSSNPGTNDAIIFNTGNETQIAKKLFPPTDAGAVQSAAGLYAGTGVPNNANGNNGDFYFRSDGGAGTCIYQRRAGAWVATGA